MTYTTQKEEIPVMRLMLESLQNIAKYTCTCTYYGEDDNGEPIYSGCPSCDAKAAIAKATGVNP